MIFSINELIQEFLPMVFVWKVRQNVRSFGMRTFLPKRIRCIKTQRNQEKHHDIT